MSKFVMEIDMHKYLKRIGLTDEEIIKMYKIHKDNTTKIILGEIYKDMFVDKKYIRDIAVIKLVKDDDEK